MLPTEQMLEKALENGDARAVADVLLSRAGRVSFTGKGEHKKAEKRAHFLATKRQKEVSESYLAKRHEKATDRLCLRHSTLKTQKARFRCSEKIWQRREDWQMKFGVYQSYHRRLMKQFEIKLFLKQNRHKLFKKP